MAKRGYGAGRSFHSFPLILAAAFATAGATAPRHRSARIRPSPAAPTPGPPISLTTVSLTFSFDMVRLTNDFAESVPPALARHDIAPDPTDDLNDIFDISRMTTFFGTSCTPYAGGDTDDAKKNEAPLRLGASFFSSGGPPFKAGQESFMGKDAPGGGVHLPERPGRTGLLPPRGSPPTSVRRSGPYGRP